uniref:Secreted protein n=1 Tax=Anopheles darlingi TaxID=43151 RepID=A0A2M4DL79_ANODA
MRGFLGAPWLLVACCATVCCLATPSGVVCRSNERAARGEMPSGNGGRGCSDVTQPLRVARAAEGLCVSECLGVFCFFFFFFISFAYCL